MKSKELLKAIEDNDINILTKIPVLKDVVVKEVIKYHYGIYSALIKLNNITYYATCIIFDLHDSIFNCRRFVVLDTVDYNYYSYEELFNRNIEIIGYYYEAK